MNSTCRTPPPADHARVEQGRPLHTIAKAINKTQRETLTIMLALENDGYAERVGTEKFWRLTPKAEAAYGQAFRGLPEAA
jgi:DNA-binding IclR family transcriptional regulator